MHLTVIIGAVTYRHDYCSECGEKIIRNAETENFAGMGAPVMQSFSGTILPELEAEESDRYLFITTCISKACMHGRRQSAHVTASEILSVVPEAAQESFGTDAREKLKAMGITSSSAFGKLVFDFINRGFLSTAEGDRPEDFMIRTVLDDFLEAN